MNVWVCGMGIVSAVGNNLEESVSSLKSGISGIGPLTLFRSSVESPVAQVKLLDDQLKEELMIDQGEVVSRSALLGMKAASEALGSVTIEHGARIGLINATTSGGIDRSEEFYRQYRKNHSLGRLRHIVGHDCADSTLRIAAHCGITGFVTTISTACSSSANAIMLGAQMVERGMLDYVVVGGTDALCRFTTNGFNALKILSNEPCKPFDCDRAGVTLGEGAAYLVLGRQKTDYCRLVGVANANDAFHQTASSDNGRGAYLAMSDAISMSGLDVSDIDYINVHGTATHNNDLSEGRAMVDLFGANNVPRFSSTKGYTGHTLAAAAAIEAVFSVMAIRENMVYASLGFSSVIDEIGLEPSLVLDTLTPVNHVLSNSFGFGGNCSSLLFSR